MYGRWLEDRGWRIEDGGLQGVSKPIRSSILDHRKIPPHAHTKRVIIFLEGPYLNHRFISDEPVVQERCVFLRMP